MTMYENVINDLKDLRGKEVSIFGQKTTLSNTCSKYVVDAIDVVEGLKNGGYIMEVEDMQEELRDLEINCDLEKIDAIEKFIDLLIDKGVIDKDQLIINGSTAAPIVVKKDNGTAAGELLNNVKDSKKIELPEDGSDNANTPAQMIVEPAVEDGSISVDGNGAINIPAGGKVKINDKVEEFPHGGKILNGEIVKHGAPTPDHGTTGGDSGGGHSYYYPTTTPVPVIVIPPKTGDMTIWQSILSFLGIK